MIGRPPRVCTSTGAPDVCHRARVVLDAAEDGVDGGALARAPAEERDALRVRAQPRVHVAQRALQVVLLRTVRRWCLGLRHYDRESMTWRARGKRIMTQTNMT